ncbi:MAG: tetratricopeptide repeat protein [Myxococcales bacterium]|nr:tetratricopeptide repeat protein [Myxococcales bacterium]
MSALLLGGCFSFVTKEEGQKMQQEINELRSQLEKREQEIRRQTEELHQLSEEAKRLTTILADSAQKAEKLQAELMQTKGQTEDIQRALEAQSIMQKNFLDYRAALDVRLEQIERRLPKPPPPIPETPDALYAEAQRLLQAKQYDDARRMLEAFVSRFADDRRAARAQFEVGETYFYQGKYKNAANAYRNVIDNFPKSEEVDDALYRSGETFFALKRCSDALVFFRELLKRNPRANLRNDANEQIREITRQQKNAAVCQS